jgi:hypothetical protein
VVNPQALKEQPLKVAIVYRRDRDKENATVEFTGTHAERDGFRFIAYGQPMKIVAIRFEREIEDTPTKA